MTGFPDPHTIQIQTLRGGHLYQTPDGSFWGATKILKILGLSTEPLISWAARVEREAVLEACAEVYAQGCDGGPAEFVALVEARIGETKQHQKIKQKAGDIGASVHQEIHRRINLMLGEPAGPEQKLTDQAEWAVMAWQDWWKQAGLTPYRAEQPVWDAELGYAGTIDLLAKDSQDRLGVVDLKSSRGIYDDHHLQVTAYINAARNFEPVDWGLIVRVPKNVEDPTFEVRELGKLYDRTLTYDELLADWRATVLLWKSLIAK